MDNPTCTATDDVADTPPQSGPSGISYPFMAPAFPHISCGNGPNGDLFMNFMDWTAEASRCMFTQGQKARMQAVLAPGGARASLASSMGGNPPCVLPVSAPTNLNVTDMTSTSATLRWTASNADNYTLQWKPTLGSTWSTVSNIASTFYTLPALTQGTAYSFKVLTNCNGTVSTYSGELAFATICPDPPTELNVTDITSPDATLSWTGVPSASSYTVQLKDFDVNFRWTYNIPGTTYHPIERLYPGRRYSFSVASNCPVGSSAYSSEVPFTTSPNPSCPAPTGLSVTNITDHNARISWDNVPGAVGYSAATFYAASNALDGSHGAPYAACCAVTLGLPMGTSFIIRVTAICGTAYSPDSVSAPSAVSLTTLGVLCSPPTLNVSNISTSSANLSWNRVSNANTYTLEWGASGDPSNKVYSIPGTTTTYALNGLLPGTRYFGIIKSDCTVPYSVLGEILAFNTCGWSVPPTLNANSITHNTVTLNWTSAPAASSYTVQWKPAAASTWNTIANIPGTTYRLVDLRPGTNYLFRVISNCSEGSTATSNAFGFTTTGCPDNFEPNESIAAARQIPVNTAVSATIGNPTDKDYFKFTTSSNAPFVKLSLTNLPANYELQLYTSGGTLVGSSTNTGTTSETVTFNYPNAGTYYAYVYGNNGANSGNCYNLKVQTSGLFGFKGANVPNTNLSGKFTLYPNPTRGEVSFEYNSKAATLATISIIDQSGRTCKTIQLKLAAGQNKPVFDISDLSKGFYYVRMVANEETLTTKLFLER